MTHTKILKQNKAYNIFARRKVLFTYLTGHKRNYFLKNI